MKEKISRKASIHAGFKSISGPTKYGGMDVSLMSKMKELEEENRRLRKMYLDEKLKAEIVTEALEKKW